MARYHLARQTVIKGLEIIIASTSHMSVRNDSSSKQRPYSSIKPERTFLVDLIWRSHTPPMWLAAGGLEIQSMFSFSNLTRISSGSNSSMAWSNSFCTPTKFVPLSLLIFLTGPRQAMKRQSARINEFDSKENGHLNVDCSTDLNM